MKVMYTIHKVGTPKISLPNHWTYDESVYWNKDVGWGHKRNLSVYTEEDVNNTDLPEDGEWVEIYVNEEVEANV